MEHWRSLVAETTPRAVAELQALCRQPAISAQNTGICETVTMLAEMVRHMDGSVRVLDGHSGHPVICAEFRPVSPASDRTLLFYNHYDVQPPDPVEEWTVAPFGAEIRDGKLFARGSSDNKANLMARLTAVRLMMESGSLPCRVKFLIEGEEEIGSPSIGQVLTAHQRLFAADACLWEFGDVDERGRPQVYGGVKGLAYLEFRCETASADLHSSLGALVESASWRLVHALESLKAPDGRIAIEGFYADVRTLAPDETEVAQRLTTSPPDLARRLGLKRPFLTVESPAQALYFSPTCTICGLQSGYHGAGIKTVLPRLAMAKVDCRLVPDQDPQDIWWKTRAHLDAHGFWDVDVSLLAGQRAFRTPATNSLVGLVLQAAGEAWEAEPVFHPSSAGSGPMYTVGHTLKVPIVSAGCSWYDSRPHAADESVRLSDYEKGILMTLGILERFGATA